MPYLKTILSGLFFWSLLLTSPCRAAGEPQLDDFPVAGIFHGKPAPVDLTSAPEAGQFRTVLRQAAAKGANFAGFYTIAQWGCGTDCNRAAIIDERTGKVQFIPAVIYFTLHYSLRSRLLIIDPLDDVKAIYAPDPPPDWFLKEGSKYFDMKDGTLNRLDMHENPAGS